MPGENIAILTPGSAMSAVATGTHTPHVTRSTSMPPPCVANMPSPLLSTGPNIFLTVLAMSSSKKKRPAHSPLDPPSSNAPMDSLDLIIGMIATLAKADSAWLPFPRSANPRRQCPIMRRRFSCVSAETETFDSPADRIRTRSDSSVATRHLAVSLSSLLIRGASFIKNRDFSMMTPLIPELAPVASLSEGSAFELLPSSCVGFSGVEVTAETSAELDCSS